MPGPRIFKINGALELAIYAMQTRTRDATDRTAESFHGVFEGCWPRPFTRNARSPTVPMLIERVLPG
jgi:hypothetical protein